MKAAAGLPRPGPNRYPIVTYLLNETPVTINDNGEMLWYDDGVDGSSDIVFQKYDD